MFFVVFNILLCIFGLCLGNVFYWDPWGLCKCLFAYSATLLGVFIGNRKLTCRYRVVCTANKGFKLQNMYKTKIQKKKSEILLPFLQAYAVSIRDPILLPKCVSQFEEMISRGRALEAWIVWQVDWILVISSDCFRERAAIATFVGRSRCHFLLNSVVISLFSFNFGAIWFQFSK